MWAKTTAQKPATNPRKGPIPWLEVKGYVDVEIQSHTRNVVDQSAEAWTLLLAEASMSLQGVPVLHLQVDSPRGASGKMGPTHQLDYTVNAYLDHVTLRAIEKNRANDVRGSLGLRLTYIREGTGAIVRANIGVETNFSQVEWSKVLDQVGWNSYWVLEMARPEIQGFDEVRKHLEKAAERLNAHDATGLLTESRSAWEAAEPLLNGAWGEMAKRIDRNAPGEKGEPSLSERIAALRKDTLKLASVGPHATFYDPTMDEAVLVYRQTVSMFEYLARKARAIEPS